MNENQPSNDPDYGVRLTGEELAAHQEKFQPRQPSAAGTEYGPQGNQASGQHASEYGPQGGQQPGQQSPGYQYPGSGQQGYQHPGYQQPPYQAPGYGQPGSQHGYQPGYQPGGQYGPGQPFGGPQLNPEMAREPKRPKTLNIAFWSIVFAGLAYFLTQLVTVGLPNRGFGDAEISMMQDMLEPTLAATPFDSVEAYLNSSLMTGAIIGQGAILFVAYILVGLAIRNGWRSMRVVGTVLAVFSLVFSLTVVSALTTLLSVLSIVLGIVGIVYAWLPASTEYYRKKAWQKAAKRAYPDAPSR